jgi:beta-galactosidase GanA
VQTYAFWNVHEPVAGELVWSGGANLTAFIEVRARVVVAVLCVTASE